ncbi:MAG: DUF2723 domain-containing protein [bacterium]|nr:DUF2723 domain-containing protein [bacterium]
MPPHTIAAAPHPGWRSSLVAGAVALAAYLALAPQVCGDKDAAEFTLVLGAGGVAHPSGYPLYTLLGHPVVKLLHAFGATWAYAANAWSALGGAVAVALLHRLARRLSWKPAASTRPIAWFAWLPVLLFGLNPLWTYETTLAETGSWHLAWAAGAVLLALRQLETRAETPTHRDALAWGLVMGAGLAHHLTALLLLVPLTFVLVRAAGRRLSVGLVAMAVLGALAPLASYGWVAWRAFHPGAAQWPALAPTWGAVWDHVTAAQYTGYFGAFRPSAGQAGLLARYAYPFLAVAAVALALAIRAAGRGPRRLVLSAVAAGCLLQLAVVFAYGVSDPGSYFVPVLGLGLMALAPALVGLASRGRGTRVLWVVLLLAMLVSVSLGAVWTGAARQRRAVFMKHETLVRRMWSSITVEPAFVLWHSDMVHQLLAWQVLDGEKPGLVVLNPATLTHAWPRAQFAERYGVDPVAGLAVPKPGREAVGGEAALVEAIAERLNEGTELPVIIFDAAVPSVRMLRKAEVPAPGSSRP